ncbi:HlyD family secretion protein [Flavisphingomonas formosensis]|uniref:HlyD family secretion protein n=1 Tax=Flavisphingomonas formosensis TaxID=861534 RepID=UPI001E5575AA|nr:HlyD family secretion protein [Sphingomonas formosensis]
MDAMTSVAAAEQEKHRRKLKLPSRRTLVASGVALAIALAGAAWIATPPAVETTDDAYVGADATTVAPKVRGLVASVLVRDNQAVKAGQPLVRIDPEEFDAKVSAAEADLADAEAGVASAKAALVSLAAEERLASAGVIAAQTTIRSTSAQADRADADRRRYQALVAGGAVARSDADRFAAAAVTAEQDAARARAELSVAQQGLGVSQAKRPGLAAAVQIAEARVAQARAALDLARQDQRHTIIYAAIDGVIGNRQVRVGDYVQPGSRLLTLVPLHALYITANFKETQTSRMRIGQAATIDVDALGGDVLKGTVESIAPGSGSTFALLPFEPGTGNFTKIVQRVPVRIRFGAGQAGADTLRPGLSVTAKVRVRG